MEDKSLIEPEGDSDIGQKGTNPGFQIGGIFAVVIKKEPFGNTVKLKINYVNPCSCIAL